MKAVISSVSSSGAPSKPPVRPVSPRYGWHNGVQIIHLMQVYYTGKPSFRRDIMHLFHNNFRRFGDPGKRWVHPPTAAWALDQCPAYPYPLHLSAGKGIRPFISLILQADLSSSAKAAFLSSLLYFPNRLFHGAYALDGRKAHF